MIGNRVGDGRFGGKMRFLWKNRGFIEKRGFRGFLVNKSGKIREEPGI